MNCSVSGDGNQLKIDYSGDRNAAILCDRVTDPGEKSKIERLSERWETFETKEYRYILMIQKDASKYLTGNYKVIRKDRCEIKRGVLNDIKDVRALDNMAWMYFKRR